MQWRWRVVLQGLPPGVQHGDRADLGAEMARVGGHVAQRGGGGAEQDGVDDARLLWNAISAAAGGRVKTT
jgi:hypothetical protein